MTYMMFDPKLLDGVKTVHFIGCGGSGTFPLIQILHARGYTITGSDVEETKNTEAERALGVQVTIGHDAANLGDAQLVVYSAAIHDDNPELKAARARGIKAVERSILLGYVSRMHSQTVGVAGTHGKTTTSGMITTMLELAGRDPAAVIGGKLPLIGGYGKAGSGPSAVIEACEYHETFLHLTCAVGVILNIDNDHLEYYGTMGQLKLAFQKFALLSRNVVFNMDDRNTLDVMNSIDRPGSMSSTCWNWASSLRISAWACRATTTSITRWPCAAACARWASSPRTPPARPRRSTAPAAGSRSRASATAPSSSTITPTTRRS